MKLDGPAELPGANDASVEKPLEAWLWDAACSMCGTYARRWRSSTTSSTPSTAYLAQLVDDEMRREYALEY